MKVKRIFFGVRALGLLLALFLGLGTVQGLAPEDSLGTAITYQGRLDKDGRPVTDTCDMTFRLYPQQSGGSQVGGTLSQSVPVSDGLFSVSLDFGGGVFDGQARWLEIEVQCPGDAGPTALPRVKLAASPYALYSLSAPWSGLTNVPAGLADGVDNDTQYLAGDGLLLDPATKTFSVQPRTYQNRVTGTCSTGKAIREINENGTVACEDTFKGTITGVYGGTGLTGSGTSGDVTLSVNTGAIQARVSQSCPADNSIRVIKADGTVECEYDDVSLYTAGNQLELVGTTLNVVEGHNSGLDADTLDAQQGSFYQNAGNLTAGTLDNARFSAHSNLTAEGFLGNADGDVAQNNGQPQVNLIADMLDGYHGSYYLNAANLSGGPLSTDLFSAYADLSVEGKLGTPSGIALNTGALQSGLNADLLDGFQSIDYQKRVIGLCGSGSAIQRIYGDGAVDCATTAGGDITKVSAGTGLSGGGDAGDVTLSADFTSVQKRVSATCAAESSIREIKEDGTVTCEADSGATYTAGKNIQIATGNVINVLDGAGSLLNADMLDGNEATAFATSTHSHAHSSLTDLTTGDDHIQYFNLSQNETVAGQPAFNGGTSGATAPFTVDSTFLVTNLNADRLDGYEAGNANGNIPVSNGTVNTNLNADQLDGKHATDFAPDFATNTEYHIIVEVSENRHGTAMTAISNSFCFLVEVDFNGLDQNEEGYCDIFVSGTAWYLEGYHSQLDEDQEVQCAARCISW